MAGITLAEKHIAGPQTPLVCRKGDQAQRIAVKPRHRRHAGEVIDGGLKAHARSREQGSCRDAVCQDCSQTTAIQILPYPIMAYGTSL